ncbi:hypothetical protein AAVH_20703 [Aphelenchoides avenae]|nr:hypothetical protein AAVH_20703 [Aphelenchus avenae]
MTDDSDDYDASVNFESVQFQEKVKALMCSSNWSGLNHCFIELLALQRDDAYNGSINFGNDFSAWIKALLELETDIHVQTLELVASYYKTSMYSVYQRLTEALHIYEYIIWHDREAQYGDELCVDVLKKTKHVSNVLDFVFSAPECEELYLAVEMHDGSHLINKLLRHLDVWRFRELLSTGQMVSTFTWEWGLGCALASCTDVEEDWEIIDCPKPITEGYAKAFKDVTHHQRRQLDPVKHSIAVGQLSGDVYEFKNEHDGTYLTVAVAKEDRTVQFRKGRFELVEAAVDHSPDKKRRLSDNHEEQRV